MQIIKKSSQWWGPPRKFDRQEEERRVSWLELFFDLVYVIAISRITHHFAMHISVDAFLEYVFMFLLIFWGWLWGIVGMFLAVPLSVLVKIVFENIQSLRFISVLMSARE